MKKRSSRRLRAVLGSYTTQKEDIDNELVSTKYVLSQIVDDDNQKAVLKSVAMEYSRSR